jgi:hypothetical protein
LGAAASPPGWHAGPRPGRGGLRTAHLITARLPHADTSGSGVRLILAAADLLQAGAVVVLDPEAGGITPARLEALAAPLREEALDLVSPLYARPADEGVLVTQLVRPLTRAIFGSDLREPLLPEFGCSARFARHCAQVDGDMSRAQWRSHYWIAAEALSHPFTVRQHPIGPRQQARRAARAGLPALFQQMVGSVFLSIEHHSSGWLPRASAGETAVHAPLDAMQPASTAGARALETIEADVRNLDEILARILPADVHAALREAARSDGASRLPGALWAQIATEFLLAHHHAVMLREHVLQALLPLYVARTGTFLIEHAESRPDALEAALEALCQDFERCKPRIVQRWARPAAR